jgi:hypothetical protein
MCTLLKNTENRQLDIDRYYTNNLYIYLIGSTFILSDAEELKQIRKSHRAF